MVLLYAARHHHLQGQGYKNSMERSVQGFAMSTLVIAPQQAHSAARSRGVNAREVLQQDSE